MTTKLTLNIKHQVIKSAKRYAKEEGRSLSELVENYLRTISTGEDSKEEISPRVKRQVGSIKLTENIDYKKSLSDAITKNRAVGKSALRYMR
jgi:hypothetical protein